jgi:nicotinate-nucleotide pyrophosphorylase (carboxylating)
VPGLRVVDKWAVLIGGGENHRMGLYDMVMIKDNHVAGAGGITAAVRGARSYVREQGLSAEIEVETRSLAEVEEVAALCREEENAGAGRVSRVMLDNMTLEQMRAAVGILEGLADTEASGNITIDTVHNIGQTGVTFISSGALTHSVTALDISLNIVV